MKNRPKKQDDSIFIELNENIRQQSLDRSELSYIMPKEYTPKDQVIEQIQRVPTQYTQVTPSEVGTVMKRSNQHDIPDGNSSANKSNINVGGKDDYTQGGTNFGVNQAQSIQNEETSIKQHLEIQQGQPMRSLRSVLGMTNKLVFNRYQRTFMGFLLFIWDTIFTFDIFILLFQVLLTGLSRRNDEGWNIIYCLAVLNIIGQSFLNLFHDYKLKMSADAVNKLTVDKFVFNRRHKRFMQRPWEELLVGDIIKIKNNQQLPADCLILDIKGGGNNNAAEQLCYIKGGPSVVNGESDTKKSCQNTQNKTGSRLSDSKFVQLLSGQIKWEFNTRGKYVGSLKLNENPAAFEFKSEHIVTRGSSLYMTEQIICMVLNIGDGCYGSVMRERQIRAPNLFNWLLKFREIKYHKYYQGEMVYNIRVLQVFALLFTFVSWIMMLFGDVIVVSSPLGRFVQQFVMRDTSGSTTISFSSIVIDVTSIQIQYMLFFPYLVKMVLDYVVFFHNLFIQWDINLVPSNIKITNYYAIDRLSQISNMVISPSSILGYRHNTVQFNAFQSKFLNLNPKLLLLNQEVFKPEQPAEPAPVQIGPGPDGAQLLPQNDGSDNSSSEGEQQSRNDIDYLPISRNPQFKFINEKVTSSLNEIPKTKQAMQIGELLRASALCHCSVLQEKVKTGFEFKKANEKVHKNFKSINKFDEAQLNFANSFGFRFVQKKGQMITIDALGKQEVYEEMAQINVDLRSIPMVVQVIRPYNSLEGCTVYFKAPLQAIKIFMKEELWPYIDNELQTMTKQGMQALTFAKKELDSEYAADLFRLIVEVQTIYKNNKQKLQDALMTQCENLDLIGTLGIKPYLNHRNAMFMEEVHRNGIKVWLLSSSLEYDTIQQINASEFLSGCSQPINVKGQNERQVEESLKASLKAASDRMQAQTEKEKDKNDPKMTVTNRPNQASAKQLSSKQLSSKQRSSKERVVNNEIAQVQPEQIEVVFTNGYALSIIMKDESLLKIFLILCSLCNCVVGSQVSANQKADLVAALKEFNLQANLGYVLSIIGNCADMYMINEADVNIGLIQKYKSSDNLALTDMNVTELHSLTYILFKHASHLNRRQRTVINFFFYRTVLIFSIMTFYICAAGLSAILPFQMYFTMIFFHILTPFQYFIFGISHKDFGFDQFHRIFGEYRNNQFVNLFTGTQALSTILKALFDAFLLCLFCLSQLLITKWSSTCVIAQNGFAVSMEAYLCYNSIVLSLIQLKHMRDNNSNIEFFQPFYYLCFFVSVTFVLDDDNLVGIKSLFTSPAMILQLVMIALIIWLSETNYQVIRNMFPTKYREQMHFYKNVEEIIFMEEYEDSNQEFSIQKNSPQTVTLFKQIKIRELAAINQNMLRLHRSDSMDQILERINITAEKTQSNSDNKIVNRSTLINKYLKMNDFNKELEYQNQPVDQRLLEPIIFTLYSFIAVIICVLISRAANETTTGQIKVSVLALLAAIIVISAGLLVVLKRFKDLNYGRILMLYIVLINILVNIEQSFAVTEPTSQLEFYSVLVCSFLLRLNSFFMVSFFCIVSLVCYCFLNFGNISSIYEDTYWNKVETYFRILNILGFAIILVLYAYWDETTRKIGFVINFRKQKEFQKSKQILNILVPSIVRSKIQEGQKNFSDAQGMVTIVFCDIEGFDELVRLYEGKELIELLDQTYNAFDQLCEQYGLQKVETVGKTYMACGGLKLVESKIDTRLLGNHFSVRVTDFAFEMLSVASNIKLKTGQKLKLKIGIHTGDVVTGVVGETKPQFSLIGDTVNKTSRVCSKCPVKNILISKETHKQLEMYSNNFLYESMEVFMKGIGTEKVYKIHKKGVRGRAIVSKAAAAQNRLNNINQLMQSKQDQSQLQIKNTSNIMQNNQNKSQTKDISGDYQEVIRTERSLDTQGDQNSDQHSQSDTEEARKQFGGFKEDKIIVNNPALNIKYKLVERPRFLLQFNQKEQEQEFQQFVSKYFIQETIWFLMIKACADTIFLFAIGWRAESNILIIQLSWVIPYVAFAVILIRVVAVTILNKPNVVAYSIMLIISLFTLTFGINVCQSIFDGTKLGVYITCQQQLEVYAALLFSLRAFQTRSTIVIQVLFVIAYAMQTFTHKQTGATFGGFADVAAFIGFTTMLIFNSYFREMQQRKQYNSERIIDIEIEKTEDLLSKLVPFHVLAGIKNDQRVVDVLENVTLLYTDMVGFTQFSNNVKNPIEVVQLLSKLFSKFDQLTEAHGVYKVHTIGDCYVIMGYTGKTPKFRRTIAVQIEEAYRVVKVGLEMIEIIREVRDQSTDPNLQSLDMRIGIHTGKIVGGIIGTKVVRYDIFGQDVLIANKMESNGKQGCVCVSEATVALLKQNQFIVDTLDFTEHSTFELAGIGKKIQSYLVEQIFMENSLGDSDENYSHGLSSNEDDKDEEGSENESAQNRGFKQVSSPEGALIY